MAETLPLVRPWIVLRTLSTRRSGATIKELAEEMAVGEKTVRRDLETFLTVGFPLEETVGRFGRKTYRLDPAKTQAGLAFAFDEAVALHLGQHLLRETGPLLVVYLGNDFQMGRLGTCAASPSFSRRDQFLGVSA